MASKNYFFSNNLIELSKKASILEKEEEFELINDWRDNKTPRSLQKILNSYLRLAVSYARKYSSYGLPIDDLIHEGVLGIMHALEKFDTSRDFRPDEDELDAKIKCRGCQTIFIAKELLFFKCNYKIEYALIENRKEKCVIQNTIKTNNVKKFGGQNQQLANYSSLRITVTKLLI